MKVGDCLNIFECLSDGEQWNETEFWGDDAWDDREMQDFLAKAHSEDGLSRRVAVIRIKYIKEKQE